MSFSKVPGSAPVTLRGVGEGAVSPAGEEMGPQGSAIGCVALAPFLTSLCPSFPVRRMGIVRGSLSSG